MYLKKVVIENIKCFGRAELNLMRDDGQVKRWNVIVGENGTGKSTLLQAIAMALMGPDPANRLARLDGWVRADQPHGKIVAEVIPGQNDQMREEARARRESYTVSYAVTGDTPVSISGIIYDRPTLVFDSTKDQLNSLKGGLLCEQCSGWFAAGYGPFRRLLGGAPDTIRQMYRGQKEARFITLFREHAALEDLTDWLTKLDHRSREANVQRIKTDQSESRAKLRQALTDRFSEEDLRTLCFDIGLDYEYLPAQGKAGKAREIIAQVERNSATTKLIELCRLLRPNVVWMDVPEMDSGVTTLPGDSVPEQLRRGDTEDGQRAQRIKNIVKDVVDHLLPPGVELSRIGSDGAFFDTPYHRATAMPDLSDGYRSMLTLAVDLLRHLEETYERVEDWISQDGKIIAEGVVLIDELDAHLHPVWQRQIGFWLPEQFPKLQFIVATHSPFIPQAADTNALWVLRSDAMAPDIVSAYQDFPSVKGWRADQILNALFSLSELRDPETEAKMRRHAELQARQTSGLLDLSEANELSELTRWLSDHLSPPGDTPEEMAKYSAIKKQLDAFLSPSRKSGASAEG